MFSYRRAHYLNKKVQKKKKTFGKHILNKFDGELQDSILPC